MVKAMGRDHAEAIVYRALTRSSSPTPASRTSAPPRSPVAQRLWGEDSPEYRATNESFAAVGLDGTWEAPEVEGC
jgi:Zn-dependent metalloprotease